MNQDQQEIFFIHFDTRAKNDEVIHQISLDTFIEVTKSLEKVLDGLNEKFFNKKINITISVLPPEKGGIEIPLILKFAGGWVIANGIKPFIKGVTGYTFDYWVEECGISVRELFMKFYREFLEKDRTQLGINQTYFLKAFAGRSDFYKACIDNQTIKGVEFHKKNYKFIKRDRFPHYVSKSVVEKLEPEYKLHKLKIISAVISKMDKQAKSLKWKGKDHKNNKSLEFYLMDSEFNIKFLNDEYPIQETNVIIAKFEYQKFKIDGEINSNKTEVSAIKIYYFNDKLITNIPDDLRIISIGENGITEKEDEPTLFDFLETKNPKNP
jgi:hypothetical protein